MKHMTVYVHSENEEVMSNYLNANNHRTPNSFVHRTLVFLSALFVVTMLENVGVVNVSGFEPPNGDERQRLEQAEIERKLLSFPGFSLVRANSDRPRSITEVHIRGPVTITDEQFKLISRIRTIESISIEKGARPSPSGWRHLAQLPSLDRIFCWRAPVGDDSVAQFARFRHLKALSLSETRITSLSLKHIGKCSRIEVLWLDKNKRLKSGGYASLAPLKKLNMLDLFENDVCDKDLPDLLQLTSLKQLELAGTAITDAGIPVLAKMQHLEDLSVMNTKISEEGRDRLDLLLPDAFIHY